MEPRLEDLQEKKAENGIEEEQEAAEAVPLLRVELTLNVAQDEPKDGQGWCPSYHPPTHPSIHPSIPLSFHLSIHQ